MNASEKYVIGVDYGTLSGRAVVVRVGDGAELGCGVTGYPHAVLTQSIPTGATLPPGWALQIPTDYIKVLRTAVPAAIRNSGVDHADVIGIATDFTACTMVPVTIDGTPLCELDQFRNRPHAYVKLLRHHAAQGQADRINSLAVEHGEEWLPRYGGFISSEWEFAKGLQILEEDPEVYGAMEHWVEAADWIVWQLTGEYVRNVCTAGYKGIYQDGQYPSKDFLKALNPKFATFIEDEVDAKIGRLGEKAGTLTEKAAGWTGLPAGIAVAVGNVDAHVTAPAAKAVEPGQMVAIMGTCTCHVMSSDELHHVPGMCGAVDGGIIDGSWVYEAGQSGVGDIFGWFVKNCVPGSYQRAAAERGLDVHEYLTSLAEQQAIGEHGLIALDWHSGNRSVLVDHELSGAILGQTLATHPEDIYRALLEATAFGTRTIIEAFNDSSVPVKEFIVGGGLLKNPLLMQIYSDIVGMPLSTIGSDQGPVLGSAIHAAVAAGAYPEIRSASQAMGKVKRGVYRPIPENVASYSQLFAEYTKLHDYFGRGSINIMHDLKQLQRNAIKNKTRNEEN